MNDRPLNILYAGTLPPHPGGSAISAWQLLSGIVRSGHRVRAIAPVTRETEDEAAVFQADHPELEISRYHLEQYYTRVFQPRGATHDECERAAVQENLTRLGARERPDIVFAGREMYAWYVPEAVRSLCVPLMLRVAGGTLFGLVSKQYPDDASRDLIERLQRFDLVVTPAAYMARQLNEMCVTRTKTILNAIDLEIFAPRTPDEALRRALGLSPSDRVVLAIGNLHARKRSLDIVAAVEQALVREPGIVCVMVGAGPLGDEIAARVRAAGIADRFRLTGWVPYADVPRYLSLAEVTLHAAEGEGLARAWLETQAAGVPLVASDLEAVREIAVDGETALLFPIGDVHALTQRLLAVLGDRLLAVQLAASARKRVARHGLSLAVERYVDAMRELCRERPVASGAPR